MGKDERRRLLRRNLPLTLLLRTQNKSPQIIKLNSAGMSIRGSLWGTETHRCKLDEWCKLTGLNKHICIFLYIHRPDALKYKESEVHSTACHEGTDVEQRCSFVSFTSTLDEGGC
jgi:hypothetical protein